MTALPWQTFGTSNQDDELVIMASRLRLRRYSSVPGFFRLAGTVRQQLARTDGLIGYSLFTRVPRKTFFTLSAWRNQEALDDFVRASPHWEVTGRLHPRMKDAVFVSWNAPSSALPVSWQEAMDRISNNDSGQGGTA